jgi:hypothetical protein
VLLPSTRQQNKERRLLSRKYIDILDTQLEVLVPAAREMYKRLAALDPDFPPPGSRWEEPTLHDIVSSLGMTPPASALHSDRCNEVLCSSCRNRNVLETTPNPGVTRNPRY